MNPRAIIMGSFAVTLGFIVYDEVKVCHELPWPPRIIGTGIAFGMIDLFALVNEQLASLFAGGFVLAIVLNTLAPNVTPGGYKFFKPSCGPHPCATAQPTSYQNLQNSPLPSTQPTTLV